MLWTLNEEGSTMKKNLYLIALLLIACVFPATAQNKATGLSGVKLFLDPGHSAKENMGLFNYTEAEKVLRVAQAIKDYLVTYTDMPADNIMLCRNDDVTVVSLTERTDMANAWGADFYYSIHSDASDNTSANSTLFMYGGRRLATGGAVIEKLPEGGKVYGDILNPNLTSVMRLSSRGNMADLTFYGSTSTTPYLSVNRTSNMASLLSEGGFHTNPVQQVRNLNAQWKRMEGYAIYQSLVKFLSAQYGSAPVDPVQTGIATGFITDNETGIPVNGAIITLTDGSNTVGTYTTDSYASLFHNYSTKPDELHNGFYYIEGLTPGTTLNARIEAVGFQSKDTTVTIPATIGATTKDGLGILDVSLLNLMPAIVTNVDPVNLTTVAVNKPLVLTFSRKMDRSSVESAISIAPAGTLSYTWSNDYTLKIDISQLNYVTAYTLKVDGTVAKNAATNDFLDGDANGTPGGDYLLNFTTGEQDLTPPVIVSYDPQGDQEISARPIVRIEFNKPLNEESIAPNQIVVTDNNGETVGGIQRYFTVNGKSVLHYLFTADLTPGATYTVSLAPGIEDLNGNQMSGGFQYTFTARPRATTLTTVLDNFNTMSSSWWGPTSSGSTLGVDPNVTKTSIDQNVLATTNNTGSLRLNYLWLEGATHRIRVHNTATAPKFSKNNVIQYYLFGDGSHTQFAIALRNGGTGLFWTNVPIEVDWVGWKLMTWDMSNDPFDNWAALGTGTGAMPAGDVLNLSALRIEGAPAAYLAYSPSTLWISQLQVVQLGVFITGTKEISVEKGINIYTGNDCIKVTAENAIKEVKIYTVAGVLLKNVNPNFNTCQIETNGWTKGVYIVKAVTETSQKNAKVFVK